MVCDAVLYWRRSVETALNFQTFSKIRYIKASKNGAHDSPIDHFEKCFADTYVNSTRILLVQIAKRLIDVDCLIFELIMCLVGRHCSTRLFQFIYFT
jgi:hypothetical protein